MAKKTSGSEEWSHFTKGDKWMIAAFAITAVTAIILFITTLALLLKVEGNLVEQKRQYDDLIQAVRKDLNENVTNARNDLLEHIKTEQIRTEKNLENSLNELAILAGWSDLGNGTRFKVFATKMNFANARRHCETYGAQLASSIIRSSTMKREILKSVFSEQLLVGLHQPHNNDTWIWIDGEPHNSSSIPWTPGEPNGEGSEKCAVVSRIQGTLHDTSCDTPWFYACQVMFL